MKYTEFMKINIELAISSLSNETYPCEFSVQEIAQETEKILVEQGIYNFNAKSRNGQTSIGMLMSQMGHIRRRVPGKSVHWLILDLKCNDI